MPEDVISLLITDHREVEEMFTRFEQAGDDAATKQELAGSMVTELTKHAAVEEALLYPLMAEVLDDGDEQVRHAIEEHREAEEALKRIEDLAPSDPGFDDAVNELIEGVRHHIEEEENELFTELREKVESTRLQQIGAQVEEAKKTAPVTPEEKEELMGSSTDPQAAAGTMGEIAGGTSGHTTIDLEETTKQELYEQAKDLEIEGRSKMDKEELAEEISKQS